MKFTSVVNTLTPGITVVSEVNLSLASFISLSNGVYSMKVICHSIPGLYLQTHIIVILYQDCTYIHTLLPFYTRTLLIYTYY